MLSSRPPTLWEEGRRPAQEVISLAVALLLTTMALSLVLSSRLGLFYDLVFVTLCVGIALAVRPAGFFPVGVLPPLAMLLVVTLVAISEPGAVARSDDGVVQATVSGLSRHAVALVLGYGACLSLLAIRRAVLLRRSGPGHPLRDE